MNLHELKPTKGARKTRKRIGRGTGSGTGETAGRGENGQNSRSGGGVRIGFEGGQNPLYRRLPKRGFTNAKFKTTHSIVNVEQLNRFEDGTVVTNELLIESKLIRKENDGIKVLGNGTLERKLTVKVDKISKEAIIKIEAAGGKVEVK